MLTVVKRSGKKQDFDPEKIRRTLACASDELKTPLGSGDLNSIVAALKKVLPESSEVSAKEIYNQLITVLNQEGFPQLAMQYQNSDKNYWD